MLVEYLEGDPTVPAVVGFDPTPPLEVDVVATTKVTVTAPEIDLAGGALVKIFATEVDLDATTASAGGSSHLAMASVFDDWAQLARAFINGMVPGTSALVSGSTTLTAGAPVDPFGAG